MLIVVFKISLALEVFFNLSEWYLCATWSGCIYIYIYIYVSLISSPWKAYKNLIIFQVNLLYSSSFVIVNFSKIVYFKLFKFKIEVKLENQNKN